MRVYTRPLPTYGNYHIAFRARMGKRVYVLRAQGVAVKPVMVSLGLHIAQCRYFGATGSFCFGLCKSEALLGHGKGPCGVPKSNQDRPSFWGLVFRV